MSACNCRSIDAAQALLELARPCEGSRNRHLLVEREPDQERERVLREERVGRIVACEIETFGHAGHPRATRIAVLGAGGVGGYYGGTLARAGHAIAGFDVGVDSEVPIGSGLSSSAALEVALLRGLRELFRIAIDDVAIARLGQRAENDLVGAPVGIMDQMAASLADEGSALFLDTRTLAFERVPLSAGAEVLVIDSGIRHRHSAGEYRTRRAECDRAAELLGVPQLRDLAEADLGRAASLPPTLFRRVRHVVTENARVLQALAALRAGDAVRLGPLMDASHLSMRDDFEISLPEIDRLVELARAEPGVLGARMTGGGFGGAIVALGRPGTAAGVPRITDGYRRDTGQEASLLVVMQGGAPRQAP